MHSRPRSVLGLLWYLAGLRLGGFGRIAALGAGALAFVLMIAAATHSSPRTQAVTPQFELPAGAQRCAHARSGDTFGVVWSSAEREHQGIDFYFALYSKQGRRVGEPVPIGWGYHAEPTCGVVADAHGFAIVWPHWDDIDNDAELHFTKLTSAGAVENSNQLQSTKLGSHVIHSLEAANTGYVVRFHTMFDDAEQVLVLDRNGNVVAAE